MNQKIVFATTVFVTTYAIVFSIYFFLNYWYGIFLSSRFGFEYGIYYWGSVLLSLFVSYMPNLVLSMAGYSLLITILISLFIIASKNSVKTATLKKIISRTLIIILIITIAVSLFGFFNNYSNGQAYAKTFITQQQFPLAYTLENVEYTRSQYTDFNAPTHWNVSVPSLFITNNQTFPVRVYVNGEYLNGNLTYANNGRIGLCYSAPIILKSGETLVYNSYGYNNTAYGAVPTPDGGRYLINFKTNYSVYCIRVTP